MVEQKEVELGTLWEGSFSIKIVAGEEDDMKSEVWRIYENFNTEKFIKAIKELDKRANTNISHSILSAMIGILEKVKLDLIVRYEVEG